MEITREQYRRALAKATVEEAEVLEKQGADVMLNRLITLAATSVARRVEVALFGEEDPKDAGNED